jgi:hypothetical protein
MPDINLNPYTAESEAIARRLRMAEMLAQQSMQPMALPQQPGVRVSHASGLAKMLDAYTAGKETRAAKEEQKALAERYQGDVASDFQTMIALCKRQHKLVSLPLSLHSKRVKAPSLKADKLLFLQDQRVICLPRVYRALRLSLCAKRTWLNCWHKQRLKRQLKPAQGMFS